MNIISEKYRDPSGLREKYKSNDPFPHIVVDDFIEPSTLEQVLSEFPNLDTLPNVIRWTKGTSIKLASKGSRDLSPSARNLINYFNSDLFLTYLQELTGINETLLSDPYLFGGGYHEIKKGGYLKIHADYNKHDYCDLDRRVNLLLYLNKDWDQAWGGNLELYDKDDLTCPVVSVAPVFNRCVIFNTTSYTYHGHPDPLNCPDKRSRRSIALYYFSTGRPEEEIAGKHSTLYVGEKGEGLKKDTREVIRDFIPPVLLRSVKRVFSRKK